MIRSGLAVAVAISATLGLGGASAADLSARAYTKVPISQAPPISWTGCYMGGNVGAGWDRFNAGEVAFGGGQIGCDYQFSSNWVVGLQAKAEFGTINSSNAVLAFPGITAQFQLKNTETMMARIGYTVAPAVLLYVKGGAGWANASAAAVVPGGLIGESANFAVTGYAVGGGLEWKFAPGWSVFGEYSLLDFGTKNVNFPSTGSVPGFGLVPRHRGFDSLPSA